MDEKDLDLINCYLAFISFCIVDILKREIGNISQKKKKRERESEIPVIKKEEEEERNTGVMDGWNWYSEIYVDVHAIDSINVICGASH